jgi:hypothetical protein
MSQIHPIKTKALCALELKEDLLGGRAFMKSVYYIIMYEDKSVKGIFPVVKGEIDQATRFRISFCRIRRVVSEGLCFTPKQYRQKGCVLL